MESSKSKFLVRDPIQEVERSCDIHRYRGELPCPWPDCPNGWEEEELVQLAFLETRPFRYKRRHWKALDGDLRFSWDCPNLPAYDKINRMVNEENRRIIGERPAPPNTIYHYTSVEGLHGIITSRSLWMTDFSYMNDSKEIQHGIKVARNVLAEFRAEDLDPRKKKVMESWFDVLNKPIPYRICIACFCDDDGDSLSQWRAYGGKHVGVSIGFKFDHSYFKQGISTRLNRVVYKEDQQRKMLANFFHICALISDWDEEKYISNMKSRKINGGKEDEPENLLTNLYGHLIFFKNEAFLDEREVRWVYSEDPESYETLGIKLAPKQFRIIGNQLIPYVTSRDIEEIYEQLSDVRSEKEHRNLPITEIVVGPQENPELVRIGIREFMDAHGYKSVTIRNSNVPFRPPKMP